MVKIKKITKAKQKKLDKRELKKKLLEWSITVKKRDRNKCAICGDTNYIHSHHIIPKEIKEFKLDIENGICLCALHHKYSYKNSAHKNPFAFMLWMVKNRPYVLKYLYDKLEEQE